MIGGVLWCTGVCYAQPPQIPPPLTVIAAPFHGGAPTAGVRYIRLLTPEEKEFYWRDTTARPGYLRIKIPGYARIFDQLATQPKGPFAQDRKLVTLHPHARYKAEVMRSSW